MNGYYGSGGGLQYLNYSFKGSLSFLNLLNDNSHHLLPAEKGGLRTVVVSGSVCLSVCCCFDFLLNFTMVMGSFSQQYGLIQSDQSESREGMYGPIHSDQSERREGV